MPREYPAGSKVEIRTVDGSIAPVLVFRDQTPPKLTAGGAVWEKVDRPKRSSATQWTGTDPYEMSVPILFDGWIDNDPQESDITRLLRMEQSPGPHQQPPRVKVSGGTPGDQLTWIVDAIEWGDNQIWGFVGGVAVRFRQDAVVRLLEYVPTDLLHKKQKRGSRGKKKVRTYVVKQGDSLSSIAARQCGSASKWRQIAKDNGIRDPKSIKKGQRLRITC
jgi:nucleoid-associated protein YgaU